jgi:hypothetical protein
MLVTRFNIHQITQLKVKPKEKMIGICLVPGSEKYTKIA